MLRYRERRNAGKSHPGFRAERNPAAARIHRKGIPGLLHVCHPGPGVAAYRRRVEAGAAAHHLRHVGTGPERGRQVQEISAHGGGRHRQVPSPRGQRLLRGHGADGAGLQLPLSRHRRPGELGIHGRSQVVCCHALHRIQAQALQSGAAGGAGAGHRRLDTQFRRHTEGAEAVAGAPAQHPVERRHRHSRGHGDGHPAP